MDIFMFLFVTLPMFMSFYGSLLFPFFILGIYIYGKFHEKEMAEHLKASRS